MSGKDLTGFSVLRFGRDGTLIDWETGIRDALQPLLMENPSQAVSRDAALAAFAQAESAQQAETPERPYPAAPSEVRCRNRALAALPVLACFFGGSAGAQQMPYVCSNTPAPEQRVLCTAENHNDDVVIDLDGVDIATDGARESGVAGMHNISGAGDVTIEVTGAPGKENIMTTGGGSSGVDGQHNGTGDIRIDVRNVDITTQGAGSAGVSALHGGTGDIAISVGDGSRIVISDAYGIEATRDSDSGDGDIAVDFGGGSRISTEGDRQHAIFAYQSSAADDTTGDITIRSDGGSLTVGGTDAYGIYVLNQATGSAVIDISNLDILTRSTAAGTRGATASHGVFAWISKSGDIDIDARGGSIVTRGEVSRGIYAILQGDGDIDIATHQGHTIVTTGSESNGIVALHGGTRAANAMSVHVGGDIVARGQGSRGVQVGRVDANENVTWAAPVGSDGYRRQRVTVNGSITSNAENVFLVGGGKVAVGPRARFDSDERVAIRATGDTADGAGPAVKPRLRVDIGLTGGSVSPVLDDNRIVNDGGETSIAVNGVLLHDGAKGAVPDAVAPNGAWNVRMRGSNTVADRDFSVADFIEEYAPRAAVYEVLPAFLLALDAPGLPNARAASPGLSPWVHVLGGTGQYEAERASAGAEYDSGRFEAEAGLDIGLGEDVTGSASLRGVRGTADVNSPGGGGEIDADGFGVAVGLSTVRRPDAWYAQGRFSLTTYSVDLASNALGSLEAGVEASANALDVEAGRRMAMGTSTTLTPRLRMTASRIDVERFADVVGSRVAVEDGSRFVAGPGVTAEKTGLSWLGGALTLRGSADLAKTLDGAQTRVAVSGEGLASQADDTRILLGLGGTYDKGGFSIRTDLAAHGPGSGDERYSGRIVIGWRF